MGQYLEMLDQVLDLSETVPDYDLEMMQPGEPEMTEDEGLPSNPDNEYGGEKLSRRADGDGLRPPLRNVGAIELWGDGTTVHSFTYVSDRVDGIYLLMHSDLEGGGEHRVSPVRDGGRAGDDAAKVARKKIHIKHVEGLVGGVVAEFWQRAHMFPG